MDSAPGLSEGAIASKIVTDDGDVYNNSYHYLLFVIVSIIIMILLYYAVKQFMAQSPDTVEGFSLKDSVNELRDLQSRILRRISAV